MGISNKMKRFLDFHKIRVSKPLLNLLETLIGAVILLSFLGIIIVMAG